MQPPPKSIVIFFGKPCKGVTVTVAQLSTFKVEVAVTGLLPEKLLSIPASFNTYSASEFKLSEIAWSPLNSKVV